MDEGYEPLTEVINRLNENVIYLPGVKLPKSIVATPDIKKCVTEKKNLRVLGKKYF